MIDFDRYATLVIQFFTGNLVITFGLCLVILVFLYKKPEETVKFLAFCVLVVTIIYIMSLLGQSGSQGMSDKKEMTRKSTEAIMDSTR